MALPGKGNKRDLLVGLGVGRHRNLRDPVGGWAERKSAKKNDWKGGVVTEIGTRLVGRKLPGVYKDGLSKDSWQQ